jgi:diaminopimelate epimerase
MKDEGRFIADSTLIERPRLRFFREETCLTSVVILMIHSYRRYTGAGNTFIVMDTASDPLGIGRMEMELLVQAICDPNRGPGADGVILINQSNQAPFRMDFYNPDGSTGMLCGNGARCAVRAATDRGYVHSDRTAFEVLSAINQAELLPTGEIRVHFQDPTIIDPRMTLAIDSAIVTAGYVDLGSQHVVVFMSEMRKLGATDIESLDVAAYGPKFRHHERLAPTGANANFIEVLQDGDEHYLRIRTFERGVEAETLACGTGCMSSAIIAHVTGAINTLPIRLKTQSEEFVVVDFTLEPSTLKVHNLTLQGSAVRGEAGVLFFDEATASLTVRPE